MKILSLIADLAAAGGVVREGAMDRPQKKRPTMAITAAIVNLRRLPVKVHLER